MARARPLRFDVDRLAPQDRVLLHHMPWQAGGGDAQRDRARGALDELLALNEDEEVRTALEALPLHRALR